MYDEVYPNPVLYRPAESGSIKTYVRWMTAQKDVPYATLQTMLIGLNGYE